MRQVSLVSLSSGFWKGRTSVAVPWRAVALAVFIHILWGGNVVALKYGLEVFPPLWSAFWRFLLGAACLLMWARFTGVAIWPTRQEWRPLCVLAFLFAVQIALMNIGIHLTTGTMAAILVSTNPFFAAMLAHLYLPGERLILARSLGLLVAFAGVSLLFLNDAGEMLQGTTRLGNLISLVSAAMLGGRLVFTSSLVQSIDPSRVMIWQMLLALPCFALGGGLLEQVSWGALGWRPVLGILYQGVVVAGFAYLVNATLLKRYSASVVIGFNFVSPLSGVWLSSVMLFERISWELLAGLVTVAMGLILINKNRKQHSA